MSNIASLISMLGAGFGGYAKGTQIYEANEREKRRDARAEEEYQFQKEARDKQRKLDRDLSASQEDQAVSATTNTGATYADESLIDADNRENRRNAEQLGVQAPAPMTATGYSANGQQFTDRGAAQAAMLGVNSQAEKDRRAAQVMRANGQIDKARQYEEFAKQAIAEGSDKFLTSISAGAPTLEAVKKAGGVVNSTVGKDAADIFNQTGGRWKSTADTPVQHFIDKDAAGREFVNSRVIGKDGTPVVADVKSAALMLTDMKTRLEQANAETRAFQTGQQIAEVSRHNLAGEKHQAATLEETRRAHDMQNRASMAHVGVAQARLADEREERKKGTVAGKIAEIESVLGPLSEADKKAYGKKLLGLTTGKDLDPALVKDITKKWSENNPQATPQDVAKFKDGLEKSFTAIKTNAQVEEALRGDFGDAKPGSPEYAKVYQQAKDKLRMTDAQLAAMGYEAPKAEKGKRPVAAVGTVTPASYTPPADSFAGRRAARIADAQAQEQDVLLQTREAFTRDAATLPPLELVQKYDEMRGRLSREQLLQLQKAERNMR